MKDILLFESIGQSIVNDAIIHHKEIKIYYDGDENIHKGERIIEPYVLGRTSKMKKAIRAFQPYGDTQTHVPEWKIFLLDNIISWKETNNVFNSPPTERGFNVHSYNQNGDNSLINIISQATFDYNNITTKPQNIQLNKQQIKPKQNQNTKVDSQNINTQQQQQKPIPQDLKNKQLNINNSTNKEKEIPSVGPLTNKDSITNDKDLQQLSKEYSKGLNMNDYNNLNIDKNTLMKNLIDYQKKKSNFLKK